MWSMVCIIQVFTQVLIVKIADLDKVVKNPLSPTEHPGGEGVNCEMFELGVEQFVVRPATYSEAILELRG